MWVDENDKKLREAAENFQPAPDESAWQKMEKMLDENLPQKKERKRIFFYLPFILLLGGLLVYLVFYRNNKDLQGTIITPGTSVINNTTNNKTGDKKIITPLSSPTHSATNPIATKGQYPEHRENKGIVRQENVKAKGYMPANKNNESANSVSFDQNSVLTKEKNQSTSKLTNSPLSRSAGKDDEIAQNSKTDKQQEEKNITPTTAETTSKTPNLNKVKHKEKRQSAFTDNFSLSFSAGPGASYVGGNNRKADPGFRSWCKLSFYQALWYSHRSLHIKKNIFCHSF